MNSMKLKVLKRVSLIMSGIMFFEALLPLKAYALTAGPSSPEFSTFTPVATSDMVNVFTGDLNYNLPVIEIPGSDGGGYAMSLSYNSGVSSEEESSWVGFGWNLNPGSINRSVRGYPDDYKNANVKLYNKSRPNYTITATATAGIETMGSDLPNIGVSGSVVTRVNNHQGYYIGQGLGLNVMGLGLNINSDPNGVTFSFDINPYSLLKNLTKKSDQKSQNSTESKTDKGNNKVSKEEWKKLSGAKMNTVPNFGAVLNAQGSSYGLYTYSEAVRSYNPTPYKGFAFNNSGISLAVNAYLPIGLHTVYKNSHFNIQYNAFTTEKFVNGYMNSNTLNSTDYHVDKDISWSPRTYFLGVPFNNSDVFNVSGEGIGGGFKYHPNSVGQHYPRSTESKTGIYQVGVEVILSQNIGVGVDFGVGVQKNIVDQWITGGGFSDNGVFRFTNDLGGEVSYGDNSIESASMIWSKATPPGSKVVSASPSRLSYNMNKNLYGSSSYIEYVQGAGSLISKLAVYNQDGNRYEYGEPVYTRNESSLQIDTKADETAIVNRYIAYRKLPLEKSGNDYHISEGNLSTDDYKTLSGEIKPVPYASSYLLTSLTTSDYVDSGTPGVIDNADFGGWTKFSYRTVYGSNDDWYRYRTPYTGLLYQQNQISDVWDDLGTVITGEKQVKYLNTVETKTHIAYFVTNKTTGTNSWTTGSGVDRKDGLSAAELANGEDPAAMSKTAKGSKKSEYLEKIVLFAKNRLDKPIKVVRFDYDYSLVQGVSNNIDGSGKLTLKRVWFEFEGTVPSKVSPYAFSYEYAASSHFSSSISTNYNQIVKYGDQYSASAQNPSYNPNALDQWGNIQPFGAERDIIGINNKFQGGIPLKGALYGWRSKVNSNVSFDPAAWNLKAIKLPSGGEIHIQYEEKDYKYVQDRPVMASATLIPGQYQEENTTVGSTLEYDKANVYNKGIYYVVNASDLGADPTDQAQVQSLVNQINTYFKVKAGQDVAGEKISFKFLYALTGSKPDLDVCQSEYISGYANFQKAALQTLSTGGYGVKIYLGSESGASGQYASIPRQACVKYVTTQREQKLGNRNCMSEPENDNEGRMRELANKYHKAGNLSFKEVVAQAKLGFSTNITQFGGGIVSSKKKLYDEGIYALSEICRTVKEECSSLKLPMLSVKKGGGVRVKRLLMYDVGIENGDAALFGSEYSYVLEDGTSSGVATNEPSSAREENALVSFLPKRGQSWFSRITAGEDKEQAEGPIGESLLPSPTIGHSRVVVQNIYKGKSGTGYTVHQFYTVKDYPFDRYYDQDNINGSGVSTTNLEDQQTKDKLSVPAGLFNFNLTRFWSVQGFRFILNNMHGQIKSISTYGGTYDPTNPQSSYLSTSKEYRYFEPGESIPLMKVDDNGNIYYAQGNPGKEMEMAMESRSISDMTFDFKIGIDLSITISWFPPIFVTVNPSFSLSDEIIKTHTTTKIISYPAIIKSVLSYQDGINSLSENLAFDAYTGKPALVRTFDSYHQVKLGDQNTDPQLDGSIYSLTIPAAYKYPQMGQKAKDVLNTNQLTASTASFVSYSIAGDPRVPGWLNAPKNVISASVQTYQNGWNTSWTNSNVVADFSVSSSDVANLSKIWRPNKSYIYRSDSVTSSNGGSKVYKGGYFDIQKPFNWKQESLNSIASNTGWLNTSTVTMYSPHGLALEEYNAIGIYSANKFGYNQRLVTMTAQNARYGSIYFNDYEDKAVSASSGITNQYAHSGVNSLSLKVSGSSGALNNFIMPNANITATPEFEKGALFKVWVKESDPSISNPLNISLNVGATNFKLDKVASTGAWTLYSVRIPKGNILSVPSNSISLVYNKDIFIDDVRFQPYESQATCYVYDNKTLRPIVVFDDQHFGLYYQYNSEGKLVRKLKETEQGLKTIQETQYNTPKVVR